MRTEQTTPDRTILLAMVVYGTCTSRFLPVCGARLLTPYLRQLHLLLLRRRRREPHRRPAHLHGLLLLLVLLLLLLLVVARRAACVVMVMRAETNTKITR